MTYHTLTLEAALDAIRVYTGFPVTLELALQDTTGGYHSDPAQSQWPIGSLWEVEGQMLYALVRAMQAQDVVELGTHRGCSTSHLAQALLDNGGAGRVRTVDIMPHAGDLINTAQRKRVELVNNQGGSYLSVQEDQSVDLILNDFPQDPAAMRRIAELAQQVLRPGGLLVTHDYAHPIVGVELQEGHARAGIEPLGVLVPPSDCGLAVWQSTVAPIQEVTWQDVAPDYASWTVKDLKVLVKERGLTTNAKRKADLIAALTEAS